MRTGVAATWLALAGLALLTAATWSAHGTPTTVASDSHRAVVPAVARDGRQPTPTPTPTPPPLPAEASWCYEPRAPETGGFVVLPAAARSIFQNCQIVAYYGYPRVPVLGVLGEFTDTEVLASQLHSTVAHFDSVNGPRSAVGALHIIAAAAQGSQTADGTYTARIPTALIEEYIAVAERHDFIVFLDLQIGWSTVEAEVARLAPHLRHPRVHLALDPEWAMPPGIPPGAAIGRLDAGQINHAQAVLQAIVDDTGLPPKVLIVHQFTASMITNKPLIADYPGVDFLIQMDGFGGRAIKLAHYQQFVVEDGAEHSGMKLFIDEDVNIFSPAEVSAIQPQPDYVQYQ